MTRVWTLAGPVRSSEEVDWESPAGPVDRLARPRLDVPAFLLAGPGDGHWVGQRCDVLESVVGDPNCTLVRLQCGCHARVPRGSLQPG
jgi:hypothetical protein